MTGPIGNFATPQSSKSVLPLDSAPWLNRDVAPRPYGLLDQIS